MPTTDLAYICEHQTCEQTKVASERPMMQRQAIQAAALCTNIMPTMAGVVTHSRNVTPRRGPRMSQMIPVQKRATMLAATARMLPVPISLLVRLREVSFFMYTISGAAANIEKKEEKKPHHETWKARECGLLLSRMTNWVALCSASTGMEKTRLKRSEEHTSELQSPD